MVKRDIVLTVIDIEGTEEAVVGSIPTKNFLPLLCETDPLMKQTCQDARSTHWSNLLMVIYLKHYDANETKRELACSY